jgi:hypothetical protein
MKRVRKGLTIGLFAAGAAFLAFGTAHTQCVGNCGTDVGNGDVTNSPGYALTGGGGGSYNYVSTAGGLSAR